MLDRLIHAGLSLLLLLAVAVLFSTNRRAIRPRIVLTALALQVRSARWSCSCRPGRPGCRPLPTSS